jgi:uncharacterized protein
MVVLVIAIISLAAAFTPAIQKKTEPVVQKVVQQVNQYDSFALSIAAMRKKSYPGSDFMIEQTLADGSNYHQYIVSYLSDGFKIYGLLTVPTTEMPKGGFPAIVFNHGYIPPAEYTTTGRYIAYVDSLARAGYVVLKPDYRGHGNSQGPADGAYYSPAYAIDVLNAVSAIKKLGNPSQPSLQFSPRVRESSKEVRTLIGSGKNDLIVNPNKIGMWGHSMGGNITMRDLVVDPKDIKVAVIWSGVVGSYTDLLNWHDPKYRPSASELALRNRYRADIIKQFGTPDKNPEFWNAIDPHSFSKDVLAHVQLHASYDDEEVPESMAESYKNSLEKAGKTVEFYTYNGADHNLSQVYDTAMTRTIAFFDKYLK